MDALKQFRLSLGLSQEKMAQRLGTSFSMYQKVERGQAQASRAFMEKVKMQFPYASIDEIFFSDVGKKGKRRE
jgi:transcriptional regulator with XRE-family HTH domain